ncbi:hypothetical protein PLESTB_001230900 [Pleodorina starrii]|uniref:AP2/ERF domain-containing protein n=1 Tax=Pleodorina starrii TaxID=330485 RepID=A0A9W6BSL5_9CHLO|nr:hypothetical protein PLESTB_001230900 [Pleodorina starrii]
MPCGLLLLLVVRYPLHCGGVLYRDLRLLALPYVVRQHNPISSAVAMARVLVECTEGGGQGMQAPIKSSGKYLYLGSYNTEAEAAAVFDQAAIRIRGPKARLNSDYVDADGKIRHDASICSATQPTPVSPAANEEPRAPPPGPRRSTYPAPLHLGSRRPREPPAAAADVRAGGGGGAGDSPRGYRDAAAATGSAMTMARPGDSGSDGPSQLGIAAESADADAAAAIAARRRHGGALEGVDLRLDQLSHLGLGGGLQGSASQQLSGAAAAPTSAPAPADGAAAAALPATARSTAAAVARLQQAHEDAAVAEALEIFSRGGLGVVVGGGFGALAGRQHAVSLWLSQAEQASLALARLRNHALQSSGRLSGGWGGSGLGQAGRAADDDGPSRPSEARRGPSSWLGQLGLDSDTKGAAGQLGGGGGGSGADELGSGAGSKRNWAALAAVEAAVEAAAAWRAGERGRQAAGQGGSLLQNLQTAQQHYAGGGDGGGSRYLGDSDPNQPPALPPASSDAVAVAIIATVSVSVISSETATSVLAVGLVAAAAALGEVARVYDSRGLLEWTPLRQQMWFTKIPPSLQIQMWFTKIPPSLQIQMWFTKIPPSLQIQLKPPCPAVARACAAWLPKSCVTKAGTDWSAGMDAAAPTDVVYQDSTVAADPGLLEWTPLRQQMWFTKIPPSLQIQMWFTKIPPSLQIQMWFTKIPPSLQIQMWFTKIPPSLQIQMWFTKIPPSLQIQLKPPCPAVARACAAWLPKNCVTKAGTDWSAGMDAAAPTDVVYQDSTVAADPGLLEWTPLRQQMWFYQDSTVAADPGLLEWAPLRQQMWFTKIPPSLQIQMWFTKIPPSLQIQMWFYQDSTVAADPGLLEWTPLRQQMWFYQDSTVAADPGLLEWTPLRQQMWFYQDSTVAADPGLLEWTPLRQQMWFYQDSTVAADPGLLEWTPLRQQMWFYQDSTVAADPGLLEWTPLRQQMWFTKIPPSLQIQMWFTKIPPSLQIQMWFTKIPPSLQIQMWFTKIPPSLQIQMWFTKIPPSLQIQLKPPCPAVARACAAWLPKNCVTKAGTDWSAGMDAAAPTDVVYQDSTVAADPGLLEWTPLRQQMWFTKIPPSLQIQMWFTKIPPSLQIQMWFTKIPPSLQIQMWFTKIPPSLQIQMWFTKIPPSLQIQMWFTKIPPSLQIQMWFTKIPPSLQIQMWFTKIPPSLQIQMWFTKIPPSLQIQLKPPCPAVARACAAWLPKNCVTKAGTDWSAGMDAAAPTDVVYQDSTVAADPGLLEWTPLRQQMWFYQDSTVAADPGLLEWTPLRQQMWFYQDSTVAADPGLLEWTPLRQQMWFYQDSTVAADPGLLEWTPLRQQMWFTKIPPSLQIQMWFTKIPPSLQIQMWFTKIPPSLQIQLKPPCPAVARACAAWLPKNCVTKAGTDWSAGMDAAAPTDVVYQDSTVAADPGLLEWTPLRQQMWFYQDSTVAADPGLLEWTPLRQQMWFTKIPPSLQIQLKPPCPAVARACAAWLPKNCVTKAGTDWSAGMDAAAPTDVVYQDSTVAADPGLLEWTPLRQQMWFYQDSTVAADPGLLEWTPLRQQMWFTKIPPSLQIQLKPPCPAVARACAAWLPKNCVTKAGTDWSAGMDAAAPTDVVYQDSTVAADPGLLEWTPLRQQMWFIKIPPSLQIQARCQEKREAEDAGHAVRDTPPRP